MVTKRKSSVLQPVSQAITTVRAASGELVLAGLGAMAKVERVGAERFAELIAEGKRVEPKLRRAVDQAVRELRSRSGVDRLPEAGDSVIRVQNALARAVSGTLSRFGFATHRDVEALSRKIDRLVETRSV